MSKTFGRGRRLLGCEDWEAGEEDCGFDISVFYIGMLVVWTATLVLSVYLWYNAVRHNEGIWMCRQSLCLCLCVTSLLLHFIDAAIQVAVIKEKGHFDDENFYGNDTASAIGTIFQAFSVQQFAFIWCDSVKAARKSEGQPDSALGSRLMPIKMTYSAIAVVNVPISIFYAVHDYSFGVDYFIHVFVWIGWGIITILILTPLSLQMYFITKKLTLHPESRLHEISKGNLIEQLLYDVSIAITLYAYVMAEIVGPDTGAMKGSVFVFSRFAFFLIHLQVLYFFIRMPKSDAFFKDSELFHLLVDEDKANEQELHDRGTLSPVT